VLVPPCGVDAFAVVAPAWMSGVSETVFNFFLWVLYLRNVCCFSLVVPQDGVLGSSRGRVALGCGVIHCCSLFHCVDIGRLYRYVLLCAASCGSRTTSRWLFICSSYIMMHGPMNLKVIFLLVINFNKLFQLGH
jgi:hypothetical protein